MIADPTARLCRYLGTCIEDVRLRARGTFIIDADGVLKAMDAQDNSIGRIAEEFLRKLQAANFGCQHQGEICPASWKPSQKTLKPGIGASGKDLNNNHGMSLLTQGGKHEGQGFGQKMGSHTWSRSTGTRTLRDGLDGSH